VVQQRVDIRKTLMEGASSKITYYDLQPLVEQQEELSSEEPSARAEAAVAAIRETRGRDAESAARFPTNCQERAKAMARRDLTGRAQDCAAAVGYPRGRVFSSRDPYRWRRGVTPAQALLVIVPSAAGWRSRPAVSNRDIGFVHPAGSRDQGRYLHSTRYGLQGKCSASVRRHNRDQPQDRSTPAAGTQTTAANRRPGANQRAFRSTAPKMQDRRPDGQPLAWHGGDRELNRIAHILSYPLSPRCSLPAGDLARMKTKTALSSSLSPIVRSESHYESRCCRAIERVTVRSGQPERRTRIRYRARSDDARRARIAPSYVGGEDRVVVDTAIEASPLHARGCTPGTRG
jgi:hypothetical protein